MRLTHGLGCIPSRSGEQREVEKRQDEQTDEFERVFSIGARGDGMPRNSVAMELIGVSMSISCELERGTERGSRSRRRGRRQETN